MQALAVVAAASAVLAAGPAPLAVTAAGRIGPVQLGHSTRADVLQLAKPDAERHTARYDALGYSCTSKVAIDADGLPHCRTILYASSGGTLEDFVTRDPRFVGPGGVHVGMLDAAAARALHRKLPAVGCQSQFFVRAKHGVLAVVLDAKRVTMLAVVGPHPLGVLGCIDRG